MTPNPSMTTEPQVTVGLVGSDVLLASSETPRTDAEEKTLTEALGGTLVGSVPADFARELERENAGLRLACEDWIKIANSAANKLNAAVQERDAEKRWTESWARSANEADDRLKTWMATADAHLATIREMRENLRNAVNLSCSCGGRPDDAPDGCPACTVWHMMANVEVTDAKRSVE